MTAARLGRYELVRKIAAGGMAEIFLARQWGAGGFFRDVVIKRLFRHLAEHPAQLRMFQDEGRLLAALSHPNIPQVYDLEFAEGHWYIAMEYVDGWNVADLWRHGVRTGQFMPLPVALGIVMQACEALHHAHERTDRARRPLRIVHRDVTPQNLMLTREGVVKLMDFGVAQTTARQDTEAGTVRGTFSYMAPEQVRAKPLDRRADVFALGVILYELTTGQRLFRGSDVQVMTQVVEQDVAPPSTRRPDYPEDLEAIVLHALERERGKRIPSAAHIAWRLEELAQRHAMPIGARAIARYVVQVIPNEPIEEASLAMVDPAHPDDRRHRSENGAPAVADEDLLDDLAKLTLPPEPPDHDAADPLPDPIALPDPDDDDDDDEELSLDDGSHEELDSAELIASDELAPDGDADEPEPERPARPTGAPLPRGVVPLPRDGAPDSLSLERDPDRPPIVLLGAPKRKPPVRSSDYVRELEERLARDDDER
jgi:serine/threonine protein kinase